LWAVLLIVVGVLAVGGVTYAMVAFQIDSVKPAGGAWTNQRVIPIQVRYTGTPGVTRITVDGKPLDVKQAPDVLTATAKGLADGRHRVEVVVGRRLGLSEVSRSWDVNVDTKPPALAVTQPTSAQVVKLSPCLVKGTCDAGSKLTLSVTPTPKGFEPVKVTADARGEWAVQLPLSENGNQIRVDAVDRAGNRASTKIDVVCDRTAPTFADASPQDHSEVKDLPDLAVRARVVETGSGIRRATVRLDEGKPVDVEVDADGFVRWTATEVAEGARQVTLEVEDNAGWTATREWKILVDTTETFGRRQMTLGARGKDVARLQKNLAKWDLLDAGDVTSVFDERTRDAVRDFQMRNKIDADGMCGFKTIAALSPHLYVNLSRFTLLLVDGGKKVKSYGIAHGMPEFPTPTGTFRIVFLERDPTWMPPKDSLWAREAKVTPPGPGNPLGTRWIGLDSGAVGIHGTPSDYSIGSRASHGCIRMHIWDVEDLFDRVSEGCEVVIFWEDQRQDIARRWWGKG